MSWRCLLDGHLRTQAIAALGDILGAADDDGSARPGLDGSGGRALLLAYASQEHHAPELFERGNALLENAVLSIERGFRQVGLWGGLADLRFLLAHLVDGADGDHALAVIDDALIDALPGLPGRIDLIGGLAGIGVAALGDPTRGRGTELARLVLGALEERAAADETGTTWFTPPSQLPDWQRALCPDGYWNLGLAHGIPGVIGFLTALVRLNVERERARALLERAVPWLLAAAPVRSPARFPSWRGHGASDAPARQAWCYGDAGVAITLLAAARALDEETWEREAHDLARAVATRDFEESGVRDMGICHGAGGVAHILNRLYQATGDEQIGEAARRWYARLLAMRHPGEAIAGFPALNRVDGADVWVEDAGVLVGATGVGLVLLAAVTEIEPSWDRLLLCDVPPQGGA